jgi:two-component system, response regulator, stage 0 sporulation protein F
MLSFSLKNHRVLVIDDEEEVRFLLQKAFTHEGADITAAETGYQGFQFLMNLHFDLVLMDLHMPGMDGFEVIRAVRQIDPAIPIIVITGYASQENRERVIALGANCFFPKPFDIEEVLNMSRKLIEERLNPDML